MGSQTDQWVSIMLSLTAMSARDPEAKIAREAAALGHAFRVGDVDSVKRIRARAILKNALPSLRAYVKEHPEAKTMLNKYETCIDHLKWTAMGLPPKEDPLEGKYSKVLAMIYRIRMSYGEEIPSIRDYADHLIEDFCDADLVDEMEIDAAINLFQHIRKRVQHDVPDKCGPVVKQLDDCIKFLEKER